MWSVKLRVQMKGERAGEFRGSKCSTGVPDARQAS